MQFFVERETVYFKQLFKIFSLFLLQTYIMGIQRGGSNQYPQPVCLSQKKNNVNHIFLI